MTRAHKKKNSKLLYMFLIFFVIALIFSIFSYIFLLKPKIQRKPSKSTQEQFSTFAKLNIPEKKDPILSYDFKNIALKLVGITTMEQFKDSSEGWKIILSPDQYIANVSCGSNDFTNCSLEFFSAARDDFVPKEYKNVNVSELCTQSISSYINGNYVYFPNDKYDPTNYLSKVFKIIFYYPKNNLSSEELVTPDWCIYYAK